MHTRLEGSGKFVFFSFLGSAGKVFGVRGGSRFAFHKYITQTLEREVGRVVIRGGGWADIDETMHTITLSGESQKYGRVTDRSRVIRLLEESYPNHTIKWAD